MLPHHHAAQITKAYTVMTPTFRPSPPNRKHRLQIQLMDSRLPEAY